MSPNTQPDMSQSLEPFVSFLAGLLFCAVPCFYLGYRMARKFRLMQWRVVVFGGLAGVAFTCLLLWQFPDAGLFAVCATPAWFYGAWWGGRENERRARRRKKSRPHRRG